MKKIAILALMMSGLFLKANCQDSTRVNKKYNYYLGVQSNELFKQLIPFNTTVSNNGNTNPYLLTFQMQNKKTKWGFRSGANYTLNTFVTEDAANKKTTETNAIHLKLGVEKYFAIGKRFKFAYGIDAATEYANNYTHNVLSSFDTTITSTENKIFKVGAGPGIRLTFNIGNRVMLGTESDAYFMLNQNTTNFAVQTISQFGGTSSSFSKSQDNSKNFKITAPVGLFLIVKL